MGLMLLTAGAVAAGDAPTRAEYVDRLEAVCEPGMKATQRAMRGVRKDIQAERIPLAARKFGRATEIFGATVTKMSRVPRPLADQKVLGRWFGHLGRQRAYLEQITVQLRADRVIKAQRLLARFIHTGNVANNTTLAFGFTYCTFKFSRFG